MKEFLYFNTKCQKCGLDMRDINYKPPCTEYKVGVFDEMTQHHTGEYPIDEPIKEYLLRTCRRCGYKWPEKCIDIYKNDAAVAVEDECVKDDSPLTYRDNLDESVGAGMSAIITHINTDFTYRNPAQQWSKIMKTLRIHGFKISFK